MMLLIIVAVGLLMFFVGLAAGIWQESKTRVGRLAEKDTDLASSRRARLALTERVNDLRDRIERAVEVLSEDLPF